MSQEISFLRTVPAIGRTERLFAPVGASIRQIADVYLGGGNDLRAFVRMPDGTMREVKAEIWNAVKPKQDNVVEFYASVHGGGGNQTLAIVAAVALAVIAPGIGSAIAGSMAAAGLFMASSAAFALTSSLITAGVMMGGSFLLQKMFPAETPDMSALESGNTQSQAVDMSTDSNPLARDTTLIHVLGGPSRVSPHDVISPHTYMDSGVEAVERLLALSGAHEIENIKISGVPVEDHPNLTVQTRSGRSDSNLITMIDRYTVPTPVQAQLSQFILGEEKALEDQVTPSNSEPNWTYFKTADLDLLSQVTIRLSIRGLVKTNDPDVDVYVPFRIQFRPAGGDDNDWINAPEIGVYGANSGVITRDMIFRWDDNFPVSRSASSINWKLWKEVPATSDTLSDGSTGTQWEADSHFAGSGGYNDVVNLHTRQAGLYFRLTESLIEKGAIEWRIKRGIAIEAPDLESNYEYNDTVRSLFLAKDNSDVWDVPAKQTDFPSEISITLATAMAEDSPVQEPGTALIAIRSRGQGFQGVTCEASGDALDWDGSAWATQSQSDNPATQTRKVLDDAERHFRIGQYSRYSRIAALGQSIVDDDQFVAWRAQCIKSGAKISYPTGGEAVSEVIQRAMAAGFARPVFGAKWSLDYFRYTENETPVLTFSPRNSSNIAALYENPMRPMGMRAKFRNAAKEWAWDEVEVRSPVPSNTQNWSSIEINAMDDADLVRQRLEFDMLRAYYWRTVYTVETALEGLGVKPGDIVGLVTDLVGDDAHGARVREVIDSTNIVIDQEIPATATSEDYSTTNDDYDNLYLTGDESYLLLTTPTGMELKTIVGASGQTIRVDSAFSSTDLVGAHLSIGSLSQTVRRCIVVDAPATGEFGTRLTLADEAPEIYQHFVDKWGWTQ